MQKAGQERQKEITQNHKAFRRVSQEREKSIIKTVLPTKLFETHDELSLSKAGNSA